MQTSSHSVQRRRRLISTAPCGVHRAQVSVAVPAAGYLPEDLRDVPPVPLRAVTPSRQRRRGRVWAARHRAHPLFTGLFALALAVGYLGVAYHVMFSMRVGASAVALSGDRGVHTGDILALPPTAAAVACMIWGIWQLSRVPVLARWLHR